jgi:Mrp family chromosome partitioning ATPase
MDTPAVLTASDAAHLISQADAVLMVARAGQTTVDEAERARELLKRLEAPVVGLALNESLGARHSWWQPALTRLKSAWRRGFSGLLGHSDED